MALVGDSIITFRAEAGLLDGLGQLAAPIAGSITLSGTSVLGGSIPAGTTVFARLTWLNQWGETLPGLEISAQILLPANAVVIVVQTPIPSGVTGGRVYFGQAAGAENQYVPLASPLGANTNILSLSGNQPSPLPNRNTAWLPDSDSDDVGAFQVYRWLNDGLTKTAELAGGIFDGVGVQGKAGELYNVVPGRWMEIKDVRYDQWYASPGHQADVFYRYVVSAALIAIVAAEAYAGRTILTSWPAPDFPGNTGTLKNAISATDSSVAVTIDAGASSFQDNGRLQIDDEVMLFNGPVGQQPLPGGAPVQASNTVVRGVGGTRPAAHLQGAKVTELKLSLTGYRYPTIYQPGDAALTLDLPPGWEVPLQRYMLSRYRRIEQQDDVASTTEQEFYQICQQLKANRGGVIRRIQVGNPRDPRIYGIGRTIIE